MTKIAPVLALLLLIGTSACGDGSDVGGDSHVDAGDVDGSPTSDVDGMPGSDVDGMPDTEIDGMPDDGGDVTPGDILASFTCPDGTAIFAEGSNTITIAGADRTFFADFPDDTSSSMGVLFSWHGFGGSADNFKDIGLDPDANPSLPVIVITPEDSGLQPLGNPQGLDWDIRSAAPDYDNVDFAFFEGMLACLDEQQDIDPARIYSFGFSAGSVMSGLLHSQYPDLLAAVILESGAWLNDQAEIDLVNVIDVDWQWPALDPDDGGAVLLTHGGPNDRIVILGVNIISLEDAAQAAFPFLDMANRVVVDCAHTGGHILDPNVTPAVISAFISAHRAGEPSPYRDGTLDGFPESCTLRLPATP